MEKVINTPSGSFKVLETKYKNKDSSKKIQVIELIPEHKVALSKTYKIIDNDTYQKAKREESILSSNPHSSIVKFIKTIEYKNPKNGINHFVIIMEYCKKGNLAGVLAEMSKKKLKFSAKILLQKFFKMVDVLAYLQNKNISHRDLKPENILIGDNDDLKLADFGDGKLNNSEKDNTLAGTKSYMSPALNKAIKNYYATGIFKVDHNLFKSDVFSLGQVLYYMTTMKKPKPCSEENLTEVSKDIEALKNEYLKKILKTMLEFTEENRPDFIELNQLMTQIKNKALCAVCFHQINSLNCVCKHCCYGFHVDCIKKKNLCISCKNSLRCTGCGDDYFYSANNCQHDLCKACHEEIFCDSHIEILEKRETSYCSEVSHCLNCMTQLIEVNNRPYCSSCSAFMCRICRFPHDENIPCLLAFIPGGIFCKCGNIVKYVQSQLFLECSSCGPVCRVCLTQSISRSHIDCANLISPSLI